MTAEELYETIGGDLCSCQRADVPSWCEKCQWRIGLLADALRAQRTEGRPSMRALADTWVGRAHALEDIAAKTEAFELAICLRSHARGLQRCADELLKAGDK